MTTRERTDVQIGQLPRLMLSWVVCLVALVTPISGEDGHDGMTVVGEVRVLPVGDILRRPANFFDLEGKTVTFTPDGAGGYAVQTGELTWVETSTENGQVLNRRKQTEISLPFAFPFAGRTWTRVHANRNGNVSFAAPETTHWKQRHPESNATMRSVSAAVDSRSAAGLEAMIAVLWNWYGKAAVSVDSSAARVVVTWNAVREFTGSHHYEPLGPNEFQLRLHPSGKVEFAYWKVSERDGIVGLFHGLGMRGRVLSTANDNLGDIPHAAVDIVSAELVDNGSTVTASVTMADDIPARMSSGRISFRIYLGSDCRVEVSVDATGRSGSTGCAPDPQVVGFTVQGPTLEIPISKTLDFVDDTVSWRVTANWHGIGYDRLYGQPVTFDDVDRDMSSMAETMTGNIFEVFHYPAIAYLGREIMSSIYGRVPADEEFAAVFTDFRFDDFRNTGRGTGPINVSVQGIGLDNPKRGSRFGSDSLLSALVGARFIGGPRWVESGNDDDWDFHGHSVGVRHIIHELVHRWAAHLRFKDPVSGRVENLGPPHWSRWLHAPVRHPVWRGFSNQPYSGRSVMGGSVWHDNGDGTFTLQKTVYSRAMGLSDLDLYVMGMIPPEEVRPTFLLRDVVETDTRGVVRATKVPVRIEDIVAALGPRVPSASEQRKVFKMGFYLLHEDGKVPRADLLVRTRNLAGDVIKYFKLATTGSTDANRPVVPVKWY